jgi:hypothetical protein
MGTPTDGVSVINALRARTGKPLLPVTPISKDQVAYAQLLAAKLGYTKPVKEEK